MPDEREMLKTCKRLREGGREGGWSERQRRRGRGSVIKEEKKGKRWGGKKAEEKRR